MSDDGNTTDDTTPPSEENDRKRPKLRAVGGKKRSKRKIPPHLFQPGNERWKKGTRPTHPKTKLEKLEHIATDALSRITIREFVVESLEGGKTRRRLKRLDAQSANAIANLIRVSMDLEGQRAGEEMAKMMEELEQLRAVVGGILEARG